ncbi:MAG: hypothetical protein M5U12_34780 [Verrucomicrobia bacterium]|nr:hypothetical protein [Verrucomicrobiota bacterium]
MFEAIQRLGDARAKGEDGESVVFFVGRENYPVRWREGAAYPWGRAQVLAAGTDVVLVGCGTLTSKVIEAGQALAAEGLKAAVVHHPFVNRPDIATLGPLVQGCGGRLVTIEDHQVVGGLGAQLSHALSRAGTAHRIVSLGIAGEFGQSAYVAEQLYEKHGLTVARVVEAARQLLR